MTPQPHALVAPKLQDAFRKIASPQFQTPSISTPLQQYTLWDSVNRENINVLNHIFWFNSANIKATKEMEKPFNIIKSAESEVDFNNAMEYVQECLQFQSTINQSLGKSLEPLLGSSMTMSSNLLLNRRDNYLKHCSKDVTEDDISRLRNVSFTPNDVFPVETLSEVQRNFIQWAHVNRDSYKSRKEHSTRHQTSLSNDRQKSDNSSSKGHFPGILQLVVSCPQTRKEMATSNRSECGKQIFACSNFQDGNCRKYSRFASTRGVGHLTRPCRCILSHTNTPTVPEISSLQCRRQILSVHCLTLRNRYGSTRVHQGCKRGETDGTCRRHQDSPVYRQLVNESKNKTAMSREYPQVDSSCAKFGLDHKF